MVEQNWYPLMSHFIENLFVIPNRYRFHVEILQIIRSCTPVETSKYLENFQIHLYGKEPCRHLKFLISAD